MKQRILQLLAKPFIGTGIGEKLPYLHNLYKRLYRTNSQATFMASIPLKMKMEVQAGDAGPGLYLASTGTFEPFETQLFIATVQPGDTIIDIGAHVGYYALLGGKLVGKKGRVIAVEASPTTYRLLKKNIKRNKLDTVVKAIHTAMSNTKGKLTFYLSKTSSGDNSLIKHEDVTDSITVPAITLDTLLTTHKLQPNHIKIDVEGAEHLVVQGMKKTLQAKSLQTLFIELTPKQSNSIDIIKTLEAAQFSIKLIDEHKQQILPYTPALFKKLSKVYGFVNILAQKK